MRMPRLIVSPMTSPTFWLFTFVICQWNVFVLAQKRYLCNDNIVIMAFNNQELNRCNHVSTTPTNFWQAWDYCHTRGGWVVNCPSCSEGQGAYIGEELLAYNGVSSIWSGLHIDTGRLVRDNFPTFSALGKLERGWNTTGALEGGQCVIEEFQELDCGGDGVLGTDETPTTTNGGGDNEGGFDTPETTLDLTVPPTADFRRRRNALPSKIPDNCLPVYKQRIVSCDERHTFACYFSGINNFFHMDVVSTNGELVLFGYGGLDRQFFLTQGKSGYGDGDAVCARMVRGGRVLRVRSEASHRVILTALSTAVQTQATMRGMWFSLDDLKRNLYWYHEGEEEGYMGVEEEEEEGLSERSRNEGPAANGYQDPQDKECKAALLSFAYSGSEEEVEDDFEGDNFATMAWPCSASLPLLCELPIEQPETPAPVTEVVVSLDFAQVIQIEGTEVTVSAEFIPNSRDAYTPECIVPDGFREFQSITLYKNGQPLQQLPYNTETMHSGKRIPFPNEDFLLPIEAMNLYHCQVNNKANNQLIDSNKMFIRISEYEIYTLHIGVDESLQYKPVWDQVYQKSLDGTLGDFQGIDGPFLGPDGQEVTSVFSQIREAIRSGGIWRSHLLDFSTHPSPRLIFYIFRVNINEMEGDFEETDVPVDRPSAILAGPETNNQEEIRIKAVQDEILGYFVQNKDFLPELSLNDFSLYSIDKCWPKNISVDSVGRFYTLPETSGGSVWTSPQTCAQDGEPLVVVECEGSKRRGYDWGFVMVNPWCDYSSDVAMDSEITDDLKTVSQENVTKDNVDAILERTKKLTDQVSDTEIQPIDVALIADILQKSSEIDDLTSDQAQEILVTATRITGLDEDVLEEAQTIGKAASRMIQSVDNLGTSLQVSDSSKFSRVVTDGLALEVWDITEDYDKNTIVGLKVLSDGHGEELSVSDLISLFSPKGLDYGEAEAAILLPKEFIESQIGRSSKNGSIRLSMNVYADTGLYSATHDLKGNMSLNSKVIAAKVLVNGVPITDLGPYNVTAVFLPKVKVPEEDRTRYSVCAWWNFRANSGYGGWSTRGCSYDRTESGRDVCVCDHLTNFAVLVSFYDQDSIDEDHDLALGIISIVGLVLSIVGLSLSILSFLCIKKLRQGRPQQTLFNLSVALLLSWVVFLAGIGRTENHVGCIAVAAMLHYLIMASFMWMLMEGILQYLLFVRVMNTYFPNYMVKTAVPAWGLPLVPVIIVLAIDPELYRGGEKYCWMSLDAFYYAFAIPVGAIILTNLAIFAMVVFSLCRRKDMSKHSSQHNSQTFINIRASFICFFILGLSWIFGFLTIEDARTVFQYVFCVSASLQGFVIFLMMTARDKSVRTFWKTTCCGCLTDSQKQKTYKTWGEKGTGSSSASGVQSVARNNKTALDATTSQTNLSTSEQVPSSQFPMGARRKGYGSEERETELDSVELDVSDGESNGAPDIPQTLY